MTEFNPGDVVLVPFPFTDLQTKKQRPAMVLSCVKPRSLPMLVIVAMITSQTETENILGDYFLLDWKSCGLVHPSKIRLAKLVTIESKLILKKLGSTSVSEQKKISKDFQKLFSHWCI